MSPAFENRFRANMRTLLFVMNANGGGPAPGALKPRALQLLEGRRSAARQAPVGEHTVDDGLHLVHQVVRDLVHLKVPVEVPLEPGDDLVPIEAETPEQGRPLAHLELVHAVRLLCSVCILRGDVRAVPREWHGHALLGCEEP